MSQRRADITWYNQYAYLILHFIFDTFECYRYMKLLLMTLRTLTSRQNLTRIFACSEFYISEMPISNPQTIENDAKYLKV